MSDRTLSLPPRFAIETAVIHDDGRHEAEDVAAFADVFDLMLDLHKEGGYAPLDEDKAIGCVRDVMKERMTFLARLEASHGEDPAGLPIGVLSMMEVPFWYSRVTFLIDLGFYVRPPYRRGKVGVALLMAVRRLAQARNKIAIVAITNPDRRPKKTAATLLAQYAGFVPLGYAVRLVINPQALQEAEAR